jgi:hypothetical protein
MFEVYAVFPVVEKGAEITDLNVFNKKIIYVYENQISVYGSKN